MILKTDRMLFVTDSEESDEYIEVLRTEYNTQTYVVRILRDQPNRPYYSLFLEYKENKRMFRKELFSSSKIDKIINYINQNLQ